jgi:hypothetical protein
VVGYARKHEITRGNSTGVQGGCSRHEQGRGYPRKHAYTLNEIDPETSEIRELNTLRSSTNREDN